MAFDFKKYHVRAMNAANETEKAAINTELKDYYASLSEDEKTGFNEALQYFLVKELGKIKSVYDGVQAPESSQN
ncbi:MAG: hypothetical protein ACI9DJ_002452 [Algoriphagus sp.]|jgi:hypothetical protein